MSGQLSISVDKVQTVNVPFQCRVHIKHGQPGDDVKIRLSQSGGGSPAYEGYCSTTLNGDGIGLAVFENVKLAGPGPVRLVANGEQSSVPLHVDDAQIQVTT
jgi:hypothetical protein